MKAYPEGSYPISEFMRDLADEITEIVKKVKTTSADGKPAYGVRVFLQEVPDIPLDAKPEDLPFPYAIVRVYNATTNEEEDLYTWLVETQIEVGIRYDDPNNQGHEPMLDILQTIADRFTWNRRLAHKYTAQQDMRLELQESDVLQPPYYFGSVGIQFRIPKNEKEGKFC